MDCNINHSLRQKSWGSENRDQPYGSNVRGPIPERRGRLWLTKKDVEMGSGRTFLTLIGLVMYRLLGSSQVSMENFPQKSQFFFLSGLKKSSWVESVKYLGQSRTDPLFTQV